METVEGEPGRELITGTSGFMCVNGNSSVWGFITKAVCKLHVGSKTCILFAWRDHWRLTSVVAIVCAAEVPSAKCSQSHQKHLKWRTFTCCDVIFKSLHFEVTLHDKTSTAGEKEARWSETQSRKIKQEVYNSVKHMEGINQTAVKWLLHASLVLLPIVLRQVLFRSFFF